MLSERIYALKALAQPLRSILHAAPESRAHATLGDSFHELQALSPALARTCLSCKALGFSLVRTCLIASACLCSLLKVSC